MNQVFVKLSRHDHHSIELKTVFEMASDGFAGSTDVFLFLPKSVGATSFRSTDLESDFSSRLRLGVPRSLDAGARAVEAAIADLAAAIGWQEAPLVESCQALAAVFSETLKLQEMEHRQDLLLRHSLLNRTRTPVGGFEAITKTLDRTGQWLSEIREIFGPSDGFVPRLLDEYLSHLFVQYVGKIDSGLTATKEAVGAAPSLEFAACWARLETAIARWLAAEQSHRERRGLNLHDGETLLVRVSHLKKFFHSSLFVDLARREPRRRWMESAAAGGAGLAAIWAAYSQSWGSNGALPSMVFMGTGIAAYVVKDRLKEWSKQYLGERLRRRIPDLEHRLLCDDDEVGLSRQWIRLKAPASIDSGVRELRRHGSSTEIESRLPEDVVHYRIAQNLSSCGRARFGTTWAAQQILRVNLERYLSRMDDPFKEVAALLPGGKLQRTPCRRLYHFYVVVRPRYVAATRRPWRKELGVLFEARDKVYRVVLDKRGIERVESLSSSAREARSASEPAIL